MILVSLSFTFTEIIVNLCKCAGVLFNSQDYKLVTVAPRVWNGFKSLGVSDAIVAYLAAIPYDPEEI